MFFFSSGPEFGDDDSEHQVKSSTDLSTETNTDSDQNQCTDTDQYQYSTRLPPGMTRADVCIPLAIHVLLQLVACIDNFDILTAHLYTHGHRFTKLIQLYCSLNIGMFLFYLAMSLCV